MPSMIGSSLGLTLPTDGASDDVWGAMLNVCLQALIDAAETGVASASGLTITGDLPYNGYSATAVGAVQFASKANAFATANYLYERDGELYWNNSSGQQLKMTAAGAINASGITGSIGGDYGAGPESVTYNVANHRYDFTYDSAKYAALRAGSLILMSVTSAQTCTVSVPASLASAVNIVLPTAAAIAATGLVLSTSSGGDTSTLSTTMAPSITSLTASGAVTAASAAISGAATTGSLTNAGSASVGANLTVTGFVSSATLSVSATAAIATAAITTGAITTLTAGTATVTGAASAASVTTAEAQARHADCTVLVPASDGQSASALFGTTMWAGGAGLGSTVCFPIKLPLGSRLKSVTGYVHTGADTMAFKVFKYDPTAAGTTPTPTQLGSTQTSAGDSATHSPSVTGLTDTADATEAFYAEVTFGASSTTGQTCRGVSYTYDRVA